MCELINSEKIKDCVRFLKSVETEDECIREIQREGELTLVTVSVKNSYRSRYMMLNKNLADLAKNIPAQKKRLITVQSGGIVWTVHADSNDGTIMLNVAGKFVTEEIDDDIINWDYAIDEFDNAFVKLVSKTERYFFSRHGKFLGTYADLGKKENKTLATELAECKRIIAENGYVSPATETVESEWDEVPEEGAGK